MGVPQELDGSEIMEVCPSKNGAFPHFRKAPHDESPDFQGQVTWAGRIGIAPFASVTVVEAVESVSEWGLNGWTIGNMFFSLQILRFLAFFRQTFHQWFNMVQWELWPVLWVIPRVFGHVLWHHQRFWRWRNQHPRIPRSIQSLRPRWNPKRAVQFFRLLPVATWRDWWFGGEVMRSRSSRSQYFLRLWDEHHMGGS